MLPPNPLQTTLAEKLDVTRKRLVLFVMGVMVCYLAITLRVIDLTLLQPATAPIAAEGEAIRPLQKPLRADILDRHGVLMATSLKVASLYADATLVEDASVLAKAIKKILPAEDEAALLQKLSSQKKFVWLARDITPRQQYALNALGDPSLGFQEEDRRMYPDKNLAVHVLGYTDVDGRGIAGVEKSFERTLGESGLPLRLTLDLRVQHIVRSALADAMKKFQAKGATGMVMDARTGEIIAMVSLPDFDPHHVGDAAADQKFNRAALGVYEMGSTFKLFSTAAALDSGQVRLNSYFDATKPIKYGRFTISDYHAKNRSLSLPETFIYSSNIATARMAQTVGNEGIRAFYKRLGFLEPPPLDLPEKGAPLYPVPWRDISTLTTSFGHGIAVSPVHLSRAAAAMVNGGIILKPRLVLEEAAQKAEGTRVIKPETSLQMRQLMELTVASGTGSKATVAGYHMGGKTGTAEKNINGSYRKNLLLSSFIGAFPIRDPRYVVLAIIDEPNPAPDTHGYATGGWTAAPAVARIVEEMAPLYNMRPDFDSDPRLVLREFAPLLKEYKEGDSLAAAGTDR